MHIYDLKNKDMAPSLSKEGWGLRWTSFVPINVILRENLKIYMRPLAILDTHASLFDYVHKHTHGD